MRHRSLQFRSILAVLAATAFVATFFGLAYKNTPTTDAAVKATDFKAGRIIDDEVFYDPNTMTVDEIQAHLDKYSANCDMWGSNKIGYGRYINGRAVDPNITRREYARLMREAGRTDYHDAPYVCISKYYENPTTHKTNFDTNAQPEEGMISAAQIIYNAAHEYNINPQVLLVMLKKESYVWGDTWPLKNEYNTVMGYACPDNAPCDSTYFGFHNQVMKAAWQLKYYKDHIYSYGYYPYMTNNIYYSPNYSCGTKAVYLENIATTSLYIYTPYTPNDAALANYPGEAYCGSYGNRNFFMYFSEWFGSTTESKQEQKINQRYNELKNSGNDLGNKLTDVPNCNIDHEGACVQAYENGVIIYSPETGAWINSGEIREKYIKSGSVDGKLGFPIGDILKDENTKSQYQRFENGVLAIVDDAVYQFEISIFDKFISNFNLLGNPLMDSNCKIGYDNACVQAFNGGVIISKEEKAWLNYGDIRAKFITMGSVDGELGFPVSDIDDENGVLVQKYESGMIIKDENGTHSLYGDFYEEYLKKPDVYGLPIMDINCNIYGHKNSCVQAFKNNSVIISSSKGIWENSGAIRKRYIEIGSVDSALGFPVGPINCNIGHEGACVQAYENGVIIYSPETGAWEGYGSIRTKYIKQGSIDGPLGFPTGPIIKNGNFYSQTFENGSLSS